MLNYQMVPKVSRNSSPVPSHRTWSLPGRTRNCDLEGCALVLHEGLTLGWEGEKWMAAFNPCWVMNLNEYIYVYIYIYVYLCNNPDYSNYLHQLWEPLSSKSEMDAVCQYQLFIGARRPDQHGELKNDAAKQGLKYHEISSRYKCKTC